MNAINLTDKLPRIVLDGAILALGLLVAVGGYLGHEITWLLVSA